MERIKDIQKKQSRYEITTEDEARFFLPLPMFKEHPLSVGDMFDETAYYVDHIASARSLCMQKAAYLLERRDYSEKMLMRKLTEAGYPEPIAQNVMAFLKDKGYVDDERFARNFAGRKAARYGAGRVMRELSMKGVCRDVLENIRDTFDEEDEARQAARYAAKYLRTHSGQDEQKTRKGVIAMLARKGYGYETALSAYRRAMETAESE